MLNVNSATKGAYRISTPKNLVVSFPNLSLEFDNDNIVQESFELSETLECQQYLTFTGCHPSRMKVTLIHVDSVLKGQYVEVSIQAGATEEISLFSGYVDSETVKDYATSTLEIVAYDVLYKLSKQDIASWYIDYFESHDDTTIKNFRDSLFEELELDVVTTTLVNDDIIFTKQYSPVQMNALDVIKALCQLNCTYGIINREGKFEFRVLPAIDSEGTYEEVAKYKSLEYQRWSVVGITKVTVRQTDDVEGGSYGTGSNVYIIQSNMFTMNLEEEVLKQIAENVYPNVAGRPYIVHEADIQGLPFVEVADALKFKVYDYTDDSYADKILYVINRKLKGIQALTDSISADGEEFRTVFISNLNAKIQTIRDQIEAIQGKMQNIELKYQQFYNERDIDIGDGQTKPVTSVKFGVAKDGQIHFEMEYLIEVETTEEVIDGYLTNSDLVLTVLYEYDGLIIDSREPKETYQDGKHILSCYYVIDVDSSLIHTWKVYLNCVGGSTHIDAYKAQNTLLGLNLLGQIAWDGLLEIEEELEPVNISATHPAIDVADLGVIISKITPTRKVISETLNIVNVRSGITIATDTDSVVINQVVKYAFVDESKQDEMTYDDYVIIDNHNFILETEFITSSASVTIDSGYCTKITPMITGLATIESVMVNEQVSN